MNHSCIPHRATLKIDPVRDRWKRSAANTPNWQVTELSTRIMVLPMAKGSVSFAVSTGQSSGTVFRIEKYIAKMTAKNMSWLESHTMVPTETLLGRLSAGCWEFSTAVTDDTVTLCLHLFRNGSLGPD